MPKYIVQANFTQEGVKGLLKEGGSKRQKAVEQTLQSVGGKLESIYWAFGETDVFVIADVPDNVSMAAVSLAVTAAGAVRTKTTVLMTAREVDQATKKAVSYRPPGA